MDKIQKRMATKSKIIGIGTGILTVVALLGWFVSSPDFKVQVSGDIFCASKCVSYFNITFVPVNPLYKNFYLYNPGGVRLGFTPEIKDYAICKPDKRCKSCGDCPSGWREVDFTKPQTNTSNYVYNFPKGIKQEFMIIGTKDPFQTVKWSLNAVTKNIDPVWIGNSKDETCKTKIIYDTCIDYINTTIEYIDNKT